MDKKISQLTAATTPLTGTEILPIVQGGNTVQATAQDVADLAGGGGYTIVNVTSTTHTATETSGNIVILVDAATAGGNVTVNLPTAVGNTAQFTVKKIDSGVNTVTVDGFGAETIDGTATKVIYTQYVSLSVVSNNTNWFII